MMNGLTAANQIGQQTQQEHDSRKRFHAPGLATMSLDAEGTVRFLSGPARNLLEFGPKQTADLAFFSMIHGRQLYQVMRDVADMVCHGKNRATWLVRMRTAKGRWKWFKAEVYNRLDRPSHSLDIVLATI